MIDTAVDMSLAEAAPAVAVPEVGAGRSAASALSFNIACLYVMHFSNYLVPFLTVPYLARILGASGWGQYVFAESWARYLSLFIEYGFALSATREVARLRRDVQGRAQLMAGVLGCQCAMAVAVILASAVWIAFVSAAHNHAALFIAATVWALCEGMSLVWYYQGLERIQSIAWVDVITKTSALLAIYVFVHRPEEVWRVLAFRAAAGAASLAVGLVLAYREIPFQLPTWGLVKKTLRSGATLFVYRSATSLSTVATVIVLGFVARPEAVGFFAGAEKISKATTALLQPISQALFPRIANLAHDKPGSETPFARLGFLLMVCGGIVLGCVMYFAAPSIVHILLGPGYEPSVAVLRVLAFLLPVMSLINMLGIQWMLPLGLDRAFNGIILSTGVLGLGAAAFLGQRFAQLGPAYALLIAQSCAAAMILITLWRSKQLQFLRNR